MIRFFLEIQYYEFRKNDISMIYFKFFEKLSFLEKAFQEEHWSLFHLDDLIIGLNGSYSF
jgi:hypothetical protein